MQHGDGMVEQQLFTLPVRALPTDIPNSLELDISGLTIGSSLRVADLPLPDAVTTDVDAEVTVAVGQPPRVEVVEVPEGEAAAEGEEASRARALPASRPRPPHLLQRRGVVPRAPPAARPAGRRRRAAPRHAGRPARGRPRQPGRRVRRHPAQRRRRRGRELSRRHGTGRLRPVRGQRASVEEVRIGDRRVALAVPTTYMNESGNAVGPLVRRFGIEDPEPLVIVHDELDLPPGGFQVKLGGGLAGHNGLRSIEAHLHTDAFVRVRIGIGKPQGGPGADHVLRRPSRADRELLDETTKRGRRRRRDDRQPRAWRRP